MLYWAIWRTYKPKDPEHQSTTVLVGKLLHTLPEEAIIGTVEQLNANTTDEWEFSYNMITKSDLEA